MPVRALPRSPAIRSIARRCSPRRRCWPRWARPCSKAVRPAWITTRRAWPRSIFNTTIAGVERADAILLIGTNLRWEAPLVNTRIRKAIKKGAKVVAIGPETDLTYKVGWLGADLSVLGNLPEAVTELFGKAARPMVILGGGAIKGAHGASLSWRPVQSGAHVEDGSAGTA
jgi:thiamine pyrophosphate-dependent acetolactate synthase large subunit-like protein